MFVQRPLFALIATLIMSGSALAIVDPAIDWRTIDTEHFTIIFDAKQEEMGREYADWAEQAFQLTASEMPEHPRRTVIALLDATDASNGNATTLPYPIINAFPVLPTPLDDIGSYGIWGRELVTHEYSHILTFTPVHGFYTPFRYIFGSIVAPNLLLPRWYEEGLAVEMETRLSHHGRLRSPFYHALLRAMALDSTLHLESLARANEVDIPSWPLGDRPYLLGSFLMTEIAHEGKGGATIDNLNQSYSRRVPYFLSAPLEREVGANQVQLFARLLNKIEQTATKEANTIKQGGEQKMQTISLEGVNNHDPAISPDGNKLAYIGETTELDELVVLTRQSQEKRPFLPEQESKIQSTGKNVFQTRLSLLQKVQKISWFPDSKRFVFDSIGEYQRYYQFSDLYVFDSETKKTKQITHGLRALDPSVSPDGRQIVFRQNLGEKTRLASVDENGENFKVVYTPETLERVSRPEFINAHEIVFASRKNGTEFLKSLELNHAHPQIVLREFAPAQFPHRTPQGLVFVSEKTGVANLYLADRELRSARPLTNSLTRAVSGELDQRNGDLYFSGLTGSGFRIQLISHDQLLKPVHPPQLSLNENYDWPVIHEPALSSNSQITTQDYSPWRYLYPRFWIPYFYLTEGGAILDASTAASDPLAKHSYQLDVAYDSILHLPSFEMDYQNATTPVITSLSYQDRYQYLYTSASTLHDQQAYVLTDWAPVLHLSTDWQTLFGWSYFREELPDFFGFSGQNLVFQQSGPTVTLNYASFSQKGRQISPESGSAFSASYTNYMPLAAGYTSYDRLKGSSQIFVSSFLPQHHVIAAQLRGIASPRLNSDFLGSPSLGFNYQPSLLAGDYLVRGYTTGTFIGRNVLSANLEYRFPLSYVYQGSDTLPVFAKRYYGYLIADAVTLDGEYFNVPDLMFEPTALGRTFVGTGFEAHADFTVGFQFPITIVAGAYYAWDQQARAFPVNIMVGLALQQ